MRDVIVGLANRCSISGPAGLSMDPPPPTARICAAGSLKQCSKKEAPQGQGRLTTSALGGCSRTGGRGGGDPALVRICELGCRRIVKIEFEGPWSACRGALRKGWPRNYSRCAAVGRRPYLTYLRTRKKMAARAYWEGHLRMSLVSIPVENVQRRGDQE